MVTSSILLSIEEVTSIEWALRKLLGEHPCTLDLDLHARILDLLAKLVFEEGLREDPSELEGRETWGVQ
mgnify:CR=1 FL=1